MSSSPTPEAVFDVTWRWVRLAMLWIMVVVVAVHIYIGLTDHLDLTGEPFWRRLGDLDSGNSFPTWLASALMAVSGVLCWAESRLADETRRRRWVVLGVLFIVVSVDEVATVHGTLQRALQLEGAEALFYGWILPAIVLSALAAIYFYPLLPTMPDRIRRRVITAGALFVGGAVGLEILSGVLSNQGLRGTWPYFAVSTIEELVEITAMFLFVDTMAVWLAERHTSVRFRVKMTRGAGE